MATNLPRIELLYDPADATVDIVFVHGIGGDRIRTWTFTATVDIPTSTFWPKDLLPKTCRTARILTFGYDSRFEHFYPLSKANRDATTTIDDHSRALLQCLAYLRYDTNSVERPIIFVAHSLGGLVCANALSQQHWADEADKRIVNSTRGLIFLGTPFQGVAEAQWALVALKYLKLMGSRDAKTPKDLGERSQQLVSINDAFIKFLKFRDRSPKPVEIAYFFETYPTYIARINIGTIATKNSAIPGVDPLPIPADHIGMCKFEDEHHNGYSSISRVLSKWIREVLAEHEIRATVQELRNAPKGTLSQVRPKPDPKYVDSYDTLVVDLWEPTSKPSSARSTSSTALQFDISHTAHLPSEGPSSSPNTSASHPSRDPDATNPETTASKLRIRSINNESELISLIYDELPKFLYEKGKTSFNVIIRQYRPESLACPEPLPPLFRDPLLQEIGRLLDIPAGFTKIARTNDGGSCTPFPIGQMKGYLIQTPFYANFKGFWSLSIKWSEANTDDPGKKCSQILAVLEVDKSVDIHPVLCEVQRLSRGYPHPIYLLTGLLEQHIERSVIQFTEITSRVADIESELRKDVDRRQNLAGSMATMETHQRLNANLHQCSIDVLDLEKRRRFEKEMSEQVKKLILSILESSPPDNKPQACLDLQLRMELFCKIAESRDLDIESLPRRISTQMTVLYNQIAQRDAWVNLDIAKAARGDNVIMINDSTAMKTIATLTTVFLPGTFIASLMSTSMFNFAEDKIYLSKKFWLYWALTIPLTVIVVIIWRIWIIVERKRRGEQNGTFEAGHEESGIGSGNRVRPLRASLEKSSRLAQD